MSASLPISSVSVSVFGTFDMPKYMSFDANLVLSQESSIPDKLPSNYVGQCSMHLCVIDRLLNKDNILFEAEAKSPFFKNKGIKMLVALAIAALSTLKVQL